MLEGLNGITTVVVVLALAESCEQPRPIAQQRMCSAERGESKEESLCRVAKGISWQSLSCTHIKIKP